MHRNVTAIYRNHATADLVRRELSELGISNGNIHIVPDRDEPVGASGRRDDNRYADQLHNLHLPDDDLRTYQHSVQRGDYVVSAEVDDDQIQRAQAIMKRPESEAYNLDSSHSEFGNETMVPHSEGDRRESNEDWRGRRDTDYTDPYTRSYLRNAPLTPR